MEQNPKQLLNTENAAQEIGLKPATLVHWRCTGKGDLPYIKIGGRIRYRRSDVMAWLDAKTHNPIQAGC